MKQLKFLILLFPILSFASDLFLTQDELRELPEEDQVRYIRKIQDVVVKMALKSDYIADRLDAQKRMVASDHPQLGPVTIAFLKEKEMTAQQLEEHMLAVKQTPQKDRQSKSYKKSLAIAMEYGSRIETAKLNAVRAELEKERAVRYQDHIAKQQEGLEQHRRDHAQATEERKNGKRSAADDSLLDDIKAGVGKIVNAVTKKTTPNPQLAQLAPARTEEAAAPAPKKFFRCIFAGWVLESDPCRGPTSLPHDYVDAFELAPENLKCSNGEYACNPILFGLTLPGECAKLESYLPNRKVYCSKLAKPICVVGHSKPTQLCQQRSSAKHMRVAAEINTNRTFNIYWDFMDKFTEICDEDKMEDNEMVFRFNGQPRKNAAAVFKDLKNTCNWAVDQLQEVVKEMRVAGQDPCTRGKFNYDENGNRINCKPMKQRKRTQGKQ